MIYTQQGVGKANFPRIFDINKIIDTFQEHCLSNSRTQQHGSNSVY